MILLKSVHPSFERYLKSLPDNERGWAQYCFDCRLNKPGLEYKNHEDFDIYFHRSLEIEGVATYYSRHAVADQRMVNVGHPPFAEHAIEEYREELQRRLTIYAKFHPIDEIIKGVQTS